MCVCVCGGGGGGAANENINTIWPTINESQRRRNWVLTAFLECAASCEARPQLTLTQRCVDYQEGIASEYYELSYTCYCLFTGPLSLNERAIKPFDCLKWSLPGHCCVQALWTDLRTIVPDTARHWQRWTTDLLTVFKMLCRLTSIRRWTPSTLPLLLSVTCCYSLPVADDTLWRDESDD